MSLFQKSVVQKYLNDLDSDLINNKYAQFQDFFGNTVRQENIRESKEEQFQEGFLRELFVKILGYTLNPEPDFNLTTELKNILNSKKADGAILKDDNALAVIELKGTDTTDLDKIETQAFGYKNHHPKCVYVITSNFEKLRFYIQNAVDHIDFDLFNLTKEQFSIMWLCLAKDNLLNGLPQKIKESSLLKEEDITKKLYSDYSKFREAIYNNLVKNNPEIDKLLLFNKTQKLLDRFLFIFFAEDRLLLPPNSISEIVKQWNTLKDLDAYVPLYDRFKLYFSYMNTGHKGKKYDIYAYNGGLFLSDEILDNISIDDDILHKHTLTLSQYDFETDVDVNILGHIFEHSLGEIESVQAEIKGETVDNQKTKRKKDGIFYTPKYITKYIVENTVGKLCEEKRTELNIIDEEYAKGRKNRKKDTIKSLDDKLTIYRDWLLSLTILDPACGSGAFLNQALDFLITEHRKIDDLRAQLFGSGFVFSDITTDILEKNIYGVDLNEESIEIAKLSLWLRTAQKGRKLNTLSNNIKCGNSLIDDPEIAGEKAFNWQKEFPEIFENGGFDVVVGNPPYGAELDKKEYYSRKYNFKSNADTYQLFTLLSNKLLNKTGLCGFIIPNSWMTRKGGAEFRKKLLIYSFHYVIDFVNQVFIEANIDTCILIYSRYSQKINKKKISVAKIIKPESITFINNYQKVNIDSWIKYDKFNCEFSDDLIKIFEKLNSISVKLGEITIITGGYKPYQVGYGKSIEGDFPQTKNDVVNWVYHSDIKVDETYFPDIKGGNIQHYYIKPNTQWVKWGSWLMSPKKYEDFINPKIVVREVAGLKLNASFDDKGYFTNDTTHMIRGAKTNTLKYILSIINSNLIGWYFSKYFGESNDLFPKIKVNELKELPINIENKKFREPLINKVDIMLSLNIDLQEISLKFLRSLTRKFSLTDFSKKLQDWYLLSYKDFLFEMGKKKIKLSLSEEAEWESYFISESEKALSLKSRIDSTDKKIDQMVYELYELTDKEIKIVERAIT